jgi:hypothetical protein
MVVGKFYISIVLKMYFIVINDLFTIIKPQVLYTRKKFPIYNNFNLPDVVTTWINKNSQNF